MARVSCLLSIIDFHGIWNFNFCRWYPFISFSRHIRHNFFFPSISWVLFISFFFFSCSSVCLEYFNFYGKKNLVIAAIFASCIPNQNDNWHNPRIGPLWCVTATKTCHKFNSCTTKHPFFPRCASLFFSSSSLSFAMLRFDHI